MRTNRILAAGTAGLLLMTGLASAEQVRLENAVTGIFISGELLEFSNQVYRVRTSVGDLMIPADQVRCTSNHCPSDIPADEIAFAVAGSDTVGSELMPLLLKGYAFTLGGVVRDAMVAERKRLFEVLRDGATAERLFAATIEDRGSTTGFEALLAGTAEIAMSSRPVKPDEIDAFRTAGHGDLGSFEQEHTIAVDGLLVVVHPDNPVDALSFEQISRLLSGRVTNWSELGGPDLPVHIYSRDTKSGTFATVSSRFLEPFSVSLAETATVVPGNAEMSTAVFADPGAVGYVGFAFRGDTRPVRLVSSCGVVTEPSAFAAKAGEYPLQRQLYLYTRNQPLSQHGAGLVAFATSPAADETIEKSGFLAFDVDAQHQDGTAATVRTAIEATQSPSETALLRELFIDLLEWDRLSPTFRFRSGSAVLDNAAQRDLARLRDYLAEAEPGTKVMLVGFTDSDGPLEANLRLGAERAEAVRRELQAALGPDLAQRVEIEAKGYGEVSPVACNDGFEGQRLNRRVEAWIQRR